MPVLKGSGSTGFGMPEAAAGYISVICTWVQIHYEPGKCPKQGYHQGNNQLLTGMMHIRKGDFIGESQGG